MTTALLIFGSLIKIRLGIVGKYKYIAKVCDEVNALTNYMVESSIGIDPGELVRIETTRRRDSTIVVG